MLQRLLLLLLRTTQYVADIIYQHSTARDLYLLELAVSTRCVLQTG